MYIYIYMYLTIAKQIKFSVLSWYENYYVDVETCSHVSSDI